MTNEQGDGRTTLADALRQLKADDAGMAASASVEEALRAEVLRLRVHRARQLRMRVLQMAAVLALAVIPLGWWLTTRTGPAPQDVTPAATIAETTTAFFPLFYSTVPVSGGHLVRTEVPQSALARFGVIAGEASGASPGKVLADVLVGDDGLARAVRFVHTTSREQ